MVEHIERQAILDAIPHAEEDKKISLFGAIADFIVLVNEIPAADVAPVVHGHWIRQDESFTRYKCSNPECGFENCSGFENYCPNCGAKMDAKYFPEYDLHG